MVRLLLLACAAPLVAPFQPVSVSRPSTELCYKKTAKEMKAKYPGAGGVQYVLTADAPPYGAEGDVLKVSRGFAVNYLAAKELGKPASAEVIAAAEVKKAEAEAADKAAYDAAATVAQGLMSAEVKIVRALGEDGDLAAVTATDVQQILTAAAGSDMSSVKVTVPSIEAHGDFPITVQLHKKLKVELTLSVVEA